MEGEEATTTSGSGDGSFFDVDFSDLLGTAVNIYDKERTRSRVGSGGDQSKTSTTSDPPQADTVKTRSYDAANLLPPWAMTLLVVSGAVLIGALAWKALR